MTCRLPIVSLTTLAIVVACSPAKSPTNDKNTFSEYEIVNKQQLTWESIFSLDGNYLVFFYSETCSYCHEMMENIISFAESGIIPTFFLDTNQNDVSFNKIGEPPTGYVPIEEFFIIGTPSLIEIEEGIITAHLVGLDDCLTYLNDKRIESNIIL